MIISSPIGELWRNSSATGERWLIRREFSHNSDGNEHACAVLGRLFIEGMAAVAKLAISASCVIMITSGGNLKLFKK
jgi:hypothetical protein